MLILALAVFIVLHTAAVQISYQHFTVNALFSLPVGVNVFVPVLSQTGLTPKACWDILRSRQNPAKSEAKFRVAFSIL